MLRGCSIPRYRRVDSASSNSGSGVASYPKLALDGLLGKIRRNVQFLTELKAGLS